LRRSRSNDNAQDRPATAIAQGAYACRRVNDRRVLNGIFWVLRSGAPWRDLPENYGPYLTNAGNKGSMVVLDLKSGEARQVLVGDRSTFADPSQHLMIGNEVALRPDDSVVTIHADGIALSPDTQWFYYRPLTDHNYRRLHAKLSATELSGEGRVPRQFRAKRRTDHECQRYTLWRRSRTPHRSCPHPNAGPSDPSKLTWADGFAISGGYLGKSRSRTVCRAPGHLRLTACDWRCW
jgi:Putative transposase of IS4/5 family (DUF4096)